MTGNRHEQAILVVMAYIVGFVTAYIAFGANQVEQATEIVYVPTSLATPADQTIASTLADAVTAANNAAAIAGAYYEQGQLSVNKNNETVLLSIDTEVMPELVNDPQFADQGLHQSSPIFIESSTGRYVYFCEEYSIPGSCRSFVYDTEQDMIIPVTINGEKSEIVLEEAATATWNDERLQINSYDLDATDGTWNMVSN